MFFFQSRMPSSFTGGPAQVIKIRSDLGLINYSLAPPNLQSLLATKRGCPWPLLSEGFFAGSFLFQTKVMSL